MEEPSDEMLDAIMDGVAKEAIKSSQAASRELERRFEEMARKIKLQRLPLSVNHGGTEYLLSKKTMRIVRQNLFWAFIYNIIGLPVAAGLFGVMLDPMWASAAMAVSSVTVVLNSLRLKMIKLK